MARQRSTTPQDDGAAPYAPSLLRVLIVERHWQKFATFRKQFERAAKELGDQLDHDELKKTTVSSRQFARWYAGDVKTEPHPDACLVLEHMFGHTVRELLEKAGHINSPELGAGESVESAQVFNDRVE